MRQERLVLLRGPRYCLNAVPPLPPLPGGVCLGDNGHEGDCVPTERRKAPRIVRGEAPRLTYPAPADSGIAILRHEDLERVQPFGADRVRLTFKSGLQVIVDRVVLSKAAGALLNPVRPSAGFYRQDRSGQ